MNVIDLIVSAAITSLQITFIHILFWDGMILQSLRNNPLPWLVKKPLYDCLICMTSIWGIFIWFFEWDGKFDLIAFLFLVGGINVLIMALVNNADDKNGEYFVEMNRQKRITSDYHKIFRN
ncbi:MAG TPA: hypothetical protein PK511_09600 [Chitinophagales bacterium]|nr:hypothetical protein [Cyclobacteriaceae bacterium]HMY35627.1 hypothetical protein [bacterium]HNI54763.1 hypothetical protein [Chitinophagales bacterium]HMY95672.1 hypothetical protein [Cyclobacteriaceae bacterium]HNA14599.1 hypothetical protein [Cyclobacteriaceae bacterium]